MVNSIEEDKLWKAYKKNPSDTIRNELILKNTYLVKQIAGRIFTSIAKKVDYDDLVSIGIIGLIDSIEKYDIDRKVKFKTYAYLRIRGEIQDYLRKQDYVPRNIREKANMIEKAYNQLQSQHCKAITDEEVANYLNIPLGEFNDIIKRIDSYINFSLEDMLEKNIYVEPISTDKDVIPHEQLENREIKRILSNAIDRLPAKERKVIQLYYYEELTLKEIGIILNLSESRISQLHTKSLLRLRGSLARYKNDLF
ncbi:MAG: FliA/WhiG family RNA polymerase sigma factor [Clostridia bacterium]|nr:FliA/WhiG family RNA polymerase sigma factor [Clostridia bacterium]